MVARSVTVLAGERIKKTQSRYILRDTREDSVNDVMV